MSFTTGTWVLGSGSGVPFEAAEPPALPEIFRLKDGDRWLGREGRTLKGAGTILWSRCYRLGLQKRKLRLGEKRGQMEGNMGAPKPSTPFLSPLSHS